VPSSKTTSMCGDAGAAEYIAHANGAG